MPITILIICPLRRQRKNPFYKRILHLMEISVGLMFFGTPHKGGNGTLVALGSLTARIATHLGFRERSDVVSALKDGSTFSDILQESFRHQLESYQIVSFYEKIGNVRSPESSMCITNTERHAGCAYAQCGTWARRPPRKNTWD